MLGRAQGNVKKGRAAMALGREKREITVSITEARRRLSWLVDFAYNGGEVIITKWGVPRARMISAKKPRWG